MPRMAAMLLKKSLLLLLTVGLALGCGGQSDKQQSQPQPPDSKYKDWNTYTYENIRIIYPPGHPQEANLREMAAGYVTALDWDCRFLGLDVAKDTLMIYFYTGFGQGHEMTGREYPFADSATIHFWIPSFYGPTLMQYLLPKWHNGEPRYRFLKHGLIALFDYSGQDYHQFTVRFLKEENFIPLSKLAADTTVNSNTERLQTAEAASFAAFIATYYGIDALKMLYLARAPFETAIQGLFMMPVDSLQKLWLDFAKERVAEMDTTEVTE